MIRQYRRKGFWCHCSEYERLDCAPHMGRGNGACLATKRSGERRTEDRGVSARAPDHSRQVGGVRVNFTTGRLRRATVDRRKAVQRG